jgi:D-alanine-D-alanine ligase
MQIGIAYDLKTADGLLPPSDDLPDDLHEEFDSPATIEAIRSALSGLGHEVVLLGDGREFLRRVLTDPPELVFNVAEGQGVGRSREARVPAVLEMLGIPCTGSDPLTLAATLDKDCAKRLVASVGVAVPRGMVLPPGDPIRTDVPLHFPLILKPACEGSSKGIRSRCLVQQAGDLAPVLGGLWRDYHQPVLVEEFIDGDELTVGLVGNDPPEIIGVMRVSPTRTAGPFVYSLEVKRDFRRQVRYECPARLSAKDQAAVERAALAVWRVLGCRDVSRVDFRLRDGVPYFLEVNPLPGLNPESSDLVILAGLRGWSYEQLIERILGATLRRLRMV